MQRYFRLGERSRPHVHWYFREGRFPCRYKISLKVSIIIFFRFLFCICSCWLDEHRWKIFQRRVRHLLEAYLWVQPPNLDKNQMQKILTEQNQDTFLKYYQARFFISIKKSKQMSRNKIDFSTIQLTKNAKPFSKLFGLVWIFVLCSAAKLVPSMNKNANEKTCDGWVPTKDIFLKKA